MQTQLNSIETWGHICNLRISPEKSHWWSCCNHESPDSGWETEWVEPKLGSSSEGVWADQTAKGWLGVQTWKGNGRLGRKDYINPWVIGGQKTQSSQKVIQEKHRNSNTCILKVIVVWLQLLSTTSILISQNCTNWSKKWINTVNSDNLRSI